MTSVDIKWKRLKIEPDDTWKRIEEKLSHIGIKANQLGRVVYVIRAANAFSIRYPKRHSPVLYIGEGRFKQRIAAHKKWIAKIYDLTNVVPIEVLICLPRVKNNRFAYKDYEAHLLEVFYARYGSLPLRNAIHETKHYNHIYANVATAAVLGPGKGKRYHWALEPLKSNIFYKRFTQTHIQPAA
ncbi:hypothetical protein [Rhodoblastus sp.]|uniref:hypothetical protein n=1 Tax=Rhodoblastus sp. TaxID=1962975 RepID=UPI003F99750D